MNGQNENPNPSMDSQSNEARMGHIPRDPRIGQTMPAPAMPGWPIDSIPAPAADGGFKATETRDLSLAEIVNSLPANHSARTSWAKLLIDVDLANSVQRMVRNHRDNRGLYENAMPSELSGRGIGLTEDKPRAGQNLPTREAFRRSIAQVNQAFELLDPADRAAMLYEVVAHLAGAGSPVRR
jgi:hypothetical protein